MPPQDGPLPPIARGQRAGRLAATEMLKTASPETGGLAGVMARLEAVVDIVAEQHQRDGMAPADARLWRFGFQAGLGVELGEQLRAAQLTISPAL